MNKYKVEISNNKEYKIKAIQDSILFTKKVEEHLSKLYYLVIQMGYLKEKNI